MEKNQIPLLALPWLPENLESLNKEEEKNRTKSILHINSNENLKDHIDIVYSSLNLIYNITHDYEHQTDNELTVQYLGIRLFNSIVTSLKLSLSGYYQTSFMVIRDILEVGFLLDYFSIDETMISHWKNCNNEERYQKYKPSLVRRELDKRDSFKQSKRTEIYQHLCEYAGHASYPGNKLVAPKGLGEIGPFFDEKYLASNIGEMAMRSPWVAMNYSGHFKNLPVGFLKPKLEFLDKYKKWGQKHFNLYMSMLIPRLPKNC